MSNRSAHTHTVALLIVIAVGSSAVARQAGQPATPAPAPATAGQGGSVILNVSQMPTPVRGKPYRFSLCHGKLLDVGDKSAPCRAQTDAGRTVSGATGNSVVTFRLENGSFLPPGWHLDGFGVITGPANADVSKVKVKICAIQLGAFGTNFNCKGQPVGFGNAVAFGNTPPPPPPTPGVGGGPSLGKGAALIAGGTGAVAAGLIAAQQLGLAGPDCSPQRSALDAAMASLTSATNSASACGSSVSCLTGAIAALNTATQSIANAGGNYCVCLGGAQVSASEKLQLQALLQGLSSPGSLPSCFQ